MDKFCECKHESRRHRVEYGKAGAGACRACLCSYFKLARFALYPGERRVLAKIAEFPVINGDLLEELLSEAGDEAVSALGAINRNLFVARFIQAGPGNTVSITDEGRAYLREKPHGG